MLSTFLFPLLTGGFHEGNETVIEKPEMIFYYDGILMRTEGVGCFGFVAAPLYQ